MNMKKLWIVVAFGLFPGSLSAENTLYYAPKGAVQEQVREGIAYAQECINLCIHNFAALDIEKDLATARNRGLRVRVVILEHDNGDKRGSLAETLIRGGYDTRVLKTQTANDQTQDFLLLDDRILVTGAYNWLAYRNRNTRGDILFYYDRDRIRAFKNTFNNLFTEAEATHFLGDRKEWIATGTPPVSVTPLEISEDSRKITQDHVRKKESAVADESSEQAMEAVSKVFLDISFDELDKQFGKESMLSRSEKNRLWKDYKGKYVRWQGIVSYKGMGRVDWNRVGVSRQDNRNHAEVEIVFDWRMFEKIMNVSAGSAITYTGKLVSRSGIDAPYRLDDGDIE